MVHREKKRLLIEISTKAAQTLELLDNETKLATLNMTKNSLKELKETIS